MSDKVLRVGIAGQGRSGYLIHAKTFHSMQDKYKIVAIADTHQDRREDAKEQFGARVYSDYKELLADGDFDLFVNALPQNFHMTASVEAMNQGLHVVCEKPLAKNAKVLDELLAVAEKNNVKFAPFQQGRFQPFFMQIMEILNSGVLGDLISVNSNWGNFARRWDWQTLQSNLGGNLLNTGPHCVDQAIAILGTDKEIHKDVNVFCKMSCHNVFEGDAEDFCSLTLHGSNIPTYNILIGSYFGYSPGPRYVITGRYGSLSGGEFELKWKYFDPKTAPKQEMWGWSVDRKYCMENLDWKEESWKLNKKDLENATGYTHASVMTAPENYYKNIHAYITDDSELKVTHHDVRRQLQIMEEAHRQNTPLIKNVEN